MSVEAVSFGCRLNAFESEAMRGLAEAVGRDDLMIVNTCAVTAEATRQARQAIRRLHREQPERAIVVTGCAAQIDTHAFAAMPQVSRVLGNAAKLRPETWRLGAAERVAVDDVMTEREAAWPRIEAMRGRTRALVPVQTGCDHRCTFCVIPFGRGNSRSVPLRAAIEQVEALVAHGAREVVLTGVDITSYGRDLPGQPTLGQLVRAVLREVPGLKRLRLSSIDSIEADRDLIAALAEEPRLMPHLHLSLQAGDDLVLKRMKRRHSRADAIRFCDDIRRLRTDIVFGADLIAGFPTESEDMFSRSLDLVDECGLTHLHVFAFSPRPGTPAARMPAVPSDDIKDRARRLRRRGEAALVEHLNRQVGEPLLVLTEATGMARSEDFTPVRLAQAVPRGQLIEVGIAGHDGRMLLAA